MKTVVIIGAGASGMMAALSASDDPDNRIILLERQQRVGKKLLCTGNGRCNLTNTGASLNNYHGESPEFAELALDNYPPEQVIEFFKSLGLLTVTEYGGRVYPLSNSANSVVDVLRFALEGRKNIELICSCPVRSVSKAGDGFSVSTDEKIIAADRLIIACGGMAGAKQGGVSDGYELLKALGHRRTALKPSLVQIKTDPTYPRALKGVRAQAALRLTLMKTELAKSKGELQFTETGLSGPAAFDISRSVSILNEPASVHCDFLFDYSVVEIEKLLSGRRKAMPDLGAEDILVGILHNRLGKMIVKYAGVQGSARLCVLSDEELNLIASACKDFCLEACGVEGFDCAQVTAGGIKTSGFKPETLESRYVKGLFACGEVLDIDGDCGGYNLQWAWASGYLAGRLGK